ncbi:MAG: GAF domain-containing sensor histidine kinase, partial [Dehalococcoidia bacterium]
MKADAEARRPSAIPAPPSGPWRWQDALAPFGRLRFRMREARFWQIQALVVLATAPHYAIESSGVISTFEDWQLNSLAISLYILPLLYAALNYRWEGALLTGLWAVVLTSPSMWLWERAGAHLITEIAQLAVMLGVGLLVAWRVDIETTERLRAEKISARLNLLNQVAQTLGETLQVEDQLPRVLRRLLAEPSVQSVWIFLGPSAPGDDPLIIREASADVEVHPLEDVSEVHRRAISLGGEVGIVDSTVVIPMFGESAPIGSLGVELADGDSLTAQENELLVTVARQICAAVEKARLYRERHEGMEFYARQVTQAHEEERLRIARDLHDETAQELVGFVRKLERLRDKAGPDVADPVDELMSQARSTLRSVRRYSRDLRPAVLDDLGLIPALEILVDDAKS